MCANTPLQLSDFDDFDYIGFPWPDLQGRGGDGGFSLRRRSQMIEVLQLRESPSSPLHALKGKEDYIFAKGLEMLGNRLPTARDTEMFAMAGNVAVGQPLGAAGTLAGLNDTARIAAMEYCPELKMFFPALHNSACFGAEPDALGCFQYLCEFGGLKCKTSRSVQWKPTKANRGNLVTLSLDVS